MKEVKKYEYLSDGYTARFINHKTGRLAPKGWYVHYDDYASVNKDLDYFKRELLILNKDNPRIRWENDHLKEEVERLKFEVNRLDKELKYERSSVRAISLDELQEVLDKMPPACIHTSHPIIPCISCMMFGEKNKNSNK